MKWENRVNAFIGNRYCLLAMSVVSVIASLLFFLFGIGGIVGGKGICSIVPQQFLPEGMLSWALGLLTVFFAAFLLGLLNKRHTFVREYTQLHMSFFLFLTCTNPDFSGSFGMPVLSGAIVAIATLILFSGWQKGKQRSYVFSVSFVLSLCSIFDSSYLLYLAAFFLGFMQMRLMSLKGFLAMLIGVFTPYWIGWGFGLFSISDLSLPQYSFSLEKYMEVLSPADVARVAISVAVGFSLGLSNAFRIMSYRLQLRAYNGFLTVLLITSVIFMVIDIANFHAYLMVLNACISVQVAHFFSIRKFQRKYLVFLLISAAYLTCSVADILKALQQ